MMTLVTANLIGLAATAAYVAFGLWVIIGERCHPGFLPTMGTAFVTAPITFPLEWIGIKPTFAVPRSLVGYCSATRRWSSALPSA